MSSTSSTSPQRSATESLNDSNRFRVRAAAHVEIRFDPAGVRGSSVYVRYFRRRRLLAEERRALGPRTDHVSIKTPPAATHIECAVEGRDGELGARAFSVASGPGIEPVGRHFIVIGAMKAGTTTLHRMLSKHPALCGTNVEVPGKSFTKEINYFSRLYRNSHSALNYDWRFDFDPAKHAWTLDVSPNYAKLPATKNVPARIANLGAETRIAYLLRDPVDRIESHLAHTLGKTGDTGSVRHCLRLSRYAAHLDLFASRIPRENILLVDFDQLCRKPRSVMKQVCAFLGIDEMAWTVRPQNRRRIRFSLTAEERARYAEELRPDAERVAAEYGFLPAERWLENWSKRRFR